MTRRTRGRSGALLAALALGLIAGCGTAFTEIGTLLDDPGRFEGRKVKISGRVESAFGVLQFGAYRLSDGSGAITVITDRGGVPREGARVGVEGEFRSAFTMGTESVAAIVESKRLDPTPPK